MKRLMMTGLCVAMTSVVLFGCASTDVVLKYAPESLKAIDKDFAVLTAASDEDTFVLSVDNTTSLLVSSDFAKTNGMDIVIETPITPFLAAGLDTTKLPEGYLVKEDMLLLTADYGNGSGNKDNLTDALLAATKANSDALSYHLELDHYGIALTRGKIEWAKDYKTNDKDIVFVLQAKPLAEIGVDVQQVEGWIFATMKEEDGGSIDLLLKPYDLK